MEEDQYEALVADQKETQWTFYCAVQSILLHAIWPENYQLDNAALDTLRQIFGIQGNYQVEKAFSVPDEPKFADIYHDTTVMPDDQRRIGLRIILRATWAPNPEDQDVYTELRRMEVVNIPLLVNQPGLLPFLVERLSMIIRLAHDAELIYAAILYTQLYSHFQDSNVIRELLTLLLVNVRSLEVFNIAKRSSILRLIHAASDPTVAEMLESDEDRHTLQLCNRNMNVPDMLLVAAGGQQVVNRVSPVGVSTWLLRYEIDPYGDLPVTLTILNEDDHESMWLSNEIDEVEYFREGFELRSVGGSRVKCILKGGGYAFEVDVIEQKDKPIVQYLRIFYEDEIYEVMADYWRNRRLMRERKAAEEGDDN